MLLGATSWPARVSGTTEARGLVRPGCYWSMSARAAPAVYDRSVAA